MYSLAFMHAGVGSSTVVTCGGCLGGAMLSYFCCKSKILQWWSFGKACAVMARRYGLHLQYRLADFIGPYWPLTDIQNWYVLISKLISFFTEFNAELDAWDGLMDVYCVSALMTFWTMVFNVQCDCTISCPQIQYHIISLIRKKLILVNSNSN